MFNFSTFESANIISLIDNLGTGLDNLKETSQEYSQASDDLQKIDVSLVNAPNDDEIGPLISDLNSLHENQGILKNEIEHLEKTKIFPDIVVIATENFPYRPKAIFDKMIKKVIK